MNSDEFNKGADWMLWSLTSDEAAAFVATAIDEALGDHRHPNIDIIAQAAVMALYDSKTSGKL